MTFSQSNHLLKECGVKRLLLVILCCLFWPGVLTANETLRMAMPDYPPYTSIQNGTYHGFGYEAFVSIMADLQQSFTIVPAPNYGRAVKDLQNQVVDGLFLASENEERNAVAEFSEAVSYSGWTWVWLKERTELDPAAADFKKKAIVSAQLNSNTYIWIVKQNYKMAGAPSNIRMLFTMLNSRRVDAILLPELTAKAVMQQEKLDPDLYSMHLEVQLPFGIYISKAYIARNPDIMPKLNQAIRRYHDRKQNSESASFD